MYAHDLLLPNGSLTHTPTPTPTTTTSVNELCSVQPPSSNLSPSLLSTPACSPYCSVVLYSFPCLRAWAWLSIPQLLYPPLKSFAPCHLFCEACLLCDTKLGIYQSQQADEGQTPTTGSLPMYPFKFPACLRASHAS